MTQKVRAYTGWEHQFDDELSEWFWTQVVGKFVATGLAISILPFTLGTAFAPEGTNRVQNGFEATVTTHEFLWTSAGKGLEAVATPLAGWLDNRSQPAE